MAGNNSIQILGGGINYDPTTSEVVLLDRQPFYSKKTGRFYVGDGVTMLKDLTPVAFYVEDLLTKEITMLETNDKTVVGSINELKQYAERIEASLPTISEEF